MKKISQDEISDMVEMVLCEGSLNEYMFKRLHSSKFTYHKHPIPGKKGKYYDNGQCEVCGKRGTYTLVADNIPAVCNKCYQTIRAYRNLRRDHLKLQKNKSLTVKQAQKIVKYMRSYSKKKALTLTLLGAYLLAEEDSE